MKKFVAVLLCLVLVFGLGATTVSAETNYCRLFFADISDLYWDMRTFQSPDVAEGESFRTEVIIRHVFGQTVCSDPNPDAKHIIPADVFELVAQKCFAVVDINALRNYEFWETVDGVRQKRRYYDAQQNAYVFDQIYTMATTVFKVMRGYSKDGNKYTVYMDFCRDFLENVSDDAVEGRDYAIYNGGKFSIEYTLKCVVETDGEIVKYHSWQKVTPQVIEGLTVPPSNFLSVPITPNRPWQGACIAPTTSSQPTTETPVVSTPQTGATSSETTASQTTVSEVTSSEVTSSQEEVPMEKVEETVSENENEALTTGGENEKEPKGNNLVLWIVLAVACVAVIGGGVAGVFFFLKKKENAIAEEQE